MRVLHVVGGLDRAGVETWLVGILRGLDRREFQFDFLAHGKGPYHYQEEAEALGGRVIHCGPYKHPLSYSVNFMRVLREYGPYDCVHCHVHHFSGFPLLLARLGGVPLRMVHSHVDTVRHEAESGIARGIYTSLMKGLIWTFTTRGAAVSEGAAASLFPSSWRRSRRWTIMRYGIDLEPFRSPVDRGHMRRNLGIPEGAFVVGHVARFFPQKNHSFLVDIATELVKRVRNAMFLLVGDGPLRSSIEQKVALHNLNRNFVFTGVRADIAAIMKGAMDAFILPSLFEGHPLVVLEAQAAGLNCVISDNISKEVDAGAGLVQRLSLDASPEVWARCLATLASNGDLRLESPISAVKSIDTSREELLQWYCA
jgi:glycosyltransferase involved in cell wall biosynthesis